MLWCFAIQFEPNGVSDQKVLAFGLGEVDTNDGSAHAGRMLP